MIRNEKVFDPAWPELDETNPVATEKLHINLSTSCGLVLEQCTDHPRSRLEVQERWEEISNEQELIGLIKIIKSLSQKYDKNTEYHHVAYHMLLCQFMLFRQGDYSNSEYKQWFKEQMEVLEAHNRGFLFGNSPGATAREIAMLGMNTETKGDVEKVQVLARGKDLATKLLLGSDRR